MARHDCTAKKLAGTLRRLGEDEIDRLIRESLEEMILAQYVRDHQTLKEILHDNLRKLHEGEYDHAAFALYKWKHRMH